ncbi:hypothetical protein BRYFOR_06098 [Marvinbryantia formatexigens DSM 14469]|uniref:Uncharacterized protein n=1 Tax=Marvinbryantia formatexigens DSM 14469 TaxID=478749 RepID=C6LBV3_9FIRM|nr:hypothetical protein BRYFOR_06098 [Marvinbryantia formatexigens DSM 14469]
MSCLRAGSCGFRPFIPDIFSIWKTVNPFNRQYFVIRKISDIICISVAEFSNFLYLQWWVLSVRQ